MAIRMVSPVVFDLIERMKAQRLYDNMKYRDRIKAWKEARAAKAAVEEKGVGE